MDFKKITLAGWNPNAAVPLAFANFDIYDVFAREDPQDLVVIDESTGFVSLVYRSKLFSLLGQDYVSAANLSESVNLSFQELNWPTSANFTGILNYNGLRDIGFDFGTGTELKEFKFDKGSLKVNVQSAFQHKVKIDITIPALEKNGASFFTSLFVDAATSNSSVELSLEENLKGFVADFTQNAPALNSLDLKYEVALIGIGNPIQASDYIALDFEFEDIKMDYARGYFGSQIVGFPSDSILIKLYQYADDGYVEIADPKITFEINNSFGIPSNFELGEIKAININDNFEIPLVGYPQQHELNYPMQLGDSALTHITLDHSNTANIHTIFEPVPKYLWFGGQVRTNPNGNLGVDNFVSKHSFLKVEANAELPMHGLAHSFKFRDTVEFGSSNIPGDIKYLKKAMLRIIVDNGFPVNGKGFVRFLDENYEEVFLISPDAIKLIKAANVDANGDVTSKIETQTDIHLTDAQIKLLPDVEHVEFYIEADTKEFQQGTYVKFYDHYNLDFKLSGQFEFLYE